MKNNVETLSHISMLLFMLNLVPNKKIHTYSTVIKLKQKLNKFVTKQSKKVRLVAVNITNEAWTETLQQFADDAKLLPADFIDMLTLDKKQIFIDTFGETILDDIFKVVIKISDENIQKNTIKESRTILNTFLNIQNSKMHDFALK